ncbi:MAG: carbohydrate binding family 9 domain-containing protein [Acidobacteria bacterium]|nr:carbohydrate binding family 9 domain-containing protein [Acidobacteriota bacterium]
MNKAAVMMMLALIILSRCFWLQASGKHVGEGAILYPKITALSPKIDGILDDPVWKEKPIINEPFIVDTPVYGEIFTQKTEVWLTYDQNNIYVAFYSHDTEPGKIKTSINKRDNLGADDWVGVDLDITGNRQYTYVHMCNPNGTQCDQVYSAYGGPDNNPDWVWYSAGNLVADGYVVEIRIPLKSLKFKSGNNVILNMAFYRFMSRAGINASWPQIDEQKGYFNSLVPVVFEKLSPQLRLEALPSLTYGSIWDRDSPSQWRKPDQSTQFGVGIKYGVTSSIDTEITINPDFSQVESDQFQVLANQRYPIFYSEKRPFFMEIKNQFDLSGFSNYTNMSTAVHTRNIIDPAWGGKIVGDWGKFFAGVLAAGDEWPGKTLDDSTNALLNEGKNANFLFGRFKYVIKGDSYIGLIYTGRKFGEDANQVIGGDVRFRLKGNNNISFNGLFSDSKDPEKMKKTTGGAITLMYDNYRRPLDLFLAVEHYTKDFRMDSAYYYRTGITGASALFGPNFYPKKNKIPWLMRLSYRLRADYKYDHATKMEDASLTNQIISFFPLQGLFSITYKIQKEAWKGQSFNQGYISANGHVQLTNWLYLQSGISYGKYLYYGENSLGHKTTFFFNTTIQLDNKFSQTFEYRYEHFTRAVEGSLVYNLNILISRTMYHFNKYIFVRSLIQYDSYQEKVLTNSKWEPGLGPGKYYQTTQSFFFKASYMIQF